MEQTAATDKTRWTTNPGQPSELELCPVALAPMGDCCCYELTSINIFYISRVCFGQYADCPIYQEVTAETPPAPAATG